MIILAGHSGLELSTPLQSLYSLAEKMEHNQASLCHFCKISSENGTNGTLLRYVGTVSHFHEQKPHLHCLQSLIP